MARKGEVLHIPLPEGQALAGLLAVRPTADMPRPGPHPTKAKRKTRALSKKR
jgi:hypothetical protein